MKGTTLKFSFSVCPTLRFRNLALTTLQHPISATTQNEGMSCKSPSHKRLQHKCLEHSTVLVIINKYAIQINSYPSHYINHNTKTVPSHKNIVFIFLKEPLCSVTAIKIVITTQFKRSRSKTIWLL